MKKTLFTIGYSGFPNVDEFVDILKHYEIQILIDVRSSPFSSHFPNYNKDNLSNALNKNNILYFNYARQFGARQENRDFYKNGRLDFETFTKSEQFMSGVANVEKSKAKIVFMCAEKKPIDCHRTIMVARAFSLRGYNIIHIMPNGMKETQKDIDRELLQKFFPKRNQSSLFDTYERNDEDFIRDAYILQNDEIGFREENLK